MDELKHRTYELSSRQEARLRQSFKKCAHRCQEKLNIYEPYECVSNEYEMEPYICDRRDFLIEHISGVDDHNKRIDDKLEIASYEDAAIDLIGEDYG